MQKRKEIKAFRLDSELLRLLALSAQKKRGERNCCGRNNAIEEPEVRNVHSGVWLAYPES